MRNCPLLLPNEFREGGGGLFQAAALVLVASPLKIAAEYGHKTAYASGPQQTIFSGPAGLHDAA